MSTATTTSHDTGQTSSRRTTTQPTNTPTTQLERSAANRLRATMAAVKLSFTWLGVRKTLAPEQRTTAARAFDADRELFSASKLILDTKNPAYRAVAAVRSEASSYWRTVTLPFPEAGIRLLPQSSLSTFASTMQTYRERLQEAARELAAQYNTIKSEAQRRLGTLFNASDYPSTLDGLFDLEVSYPTIEPPNYLMALHPEVYQQEQARHRHRYHGVFAPNHPLRPDVTALAIGNLGKRGDAASSLPRPKEQGRGEGARNHEQPRSHDTSRIAWAKLIARIAEHFPLACPACGGDIRLIAFITDPEPIRKILLHLGEPLEPPPLMPARGPPTSWTELVQVHDDRDAIQSSPDDLPVIDISSL